MKLSDILSNSGGNSRGQNMHLRRLALRRQLWPSVEGTDIWDRKSAKGFTTIPRTLPLFGLIMDRLSVSKPVFSTYLGLWCRTFDEGFVTLDRPQEMAFSAGFTTARGGHIWAERLGILAKLGFINLAPGQYGPRSFALILNPYRVVAALRESSEVSIEPAIWNALISHASTIGATDLDEPTISKAKKPRKPAIKRFSLESIPVKESTVLRAKVLVAWQQVRETYMSSIKYRYITRGEIVSMKNDDCFAIGFPRDDENSLRSIVGEMGRKDAEGKLRAIVGQPVKIEFVVSDAQ